MNGRNRLKYRLKTALWSRPFVLFLAISIIISTLAIFPKLNIFKPEVVEALTTGNVAPSTATAITAAGHGDQNGFQTGTVSDVQTNDNSTYLVDTNSGTATGNTCSGNAAIAQGMDKHDFYDFSLNIPASGATINGITVTMDAKYDSANGTNTFCVWLYNGTSWAAGYESADIANTDTTFSVGGSADNWGLTWTGATANSLTVRVGMNVANNSRDASLDYLAVNVDYSLAPPTIESAHHYSLFIGQSATSTHPITLTSLGLITAANDLRIAIATSTHNMRWDTTDTTATIGGTGAAKVSTTVSYEGGGSVLVVPVNTDLAATETLIISGVSLTSFAAPAVNATSALMVFAGGPGDQTADARDPMGVYIRDQGSITVNNHAQGQVSNKFETGVTSTSTEFYRFGFNNTSPDGEATFSLDLSSITGIAADDILNVRLYKDVDGDGNKDGESGTWATAFDGSQEEITALALDSKQDVIYVGQGTGTGDGDIYRCVTSTGCDETTDWTLAFDGSQEEISSLLYDEEYDFLYAGQGSGTGDSDLYRCPTITGCDETSDWISVFNGERSTLAAVVTASPLTRATTTKYVYFSQADPSSHQHDIYGCDMLTSFCGVQSDWVLLNTLNSEDIIGMIVDEYVLLRFASNATGDSTGFLKKCETSTCDNISILMSSSTVDVRSLAYNPSSQKVYVGYNDANGSKVMWCLVNGYTGCGASTNFTITAIAGIGNTISDLSVDYANLDIYASDDSGVTIDVYRCSESTDCNVPSEWVLLHDNYATDIGGFLGEPATNSVYVGLNQGSGNDIKRYFYGDPAVFDMTPYATTTLYVTANSSRVIYDVTLDTVNNVLYVGTGYTGAAGTGDIYRCDIVSTNCDAPADWIKTFEGAKTQLVALAIDTDNNVIYAGQGGTGATDGVIYRCAISTSCDETTDWTLAFQSAVEYINSLLYDSANNIMYAGQRGGTAGEGDIYRCITSTSCDETTDWTLAYDGEIIGVPKLGMDTTNNVIYAGMGPASLSGDIYRCVTSTGCDETTDWTLAFDGSQESIEGFGFDSVNGVMYAGQGGSSTGDGDIYRCAISTSCDETTDWTLAYDGTTINDGSAFNAAAATDFLIDLTVKMIYTTFGANLTLNNLVTGFVMGCYLPTGCDETNDWLYVNQGVPFTVSINRSINSITSFTDPANGREYMLISVGYTTSAGLNAVGRFTRGDFKVSIPGTSGSIAFVSTTTTQNFVSSATTTLPVGQSYYLMESLVANIASNDAITMGLSSTNVRGYDYTGLNELTVSGSASNITHQLGAASPGTLTLSEHTLGQQTNRFAIAGTSVTDETLFRFRLTKSTENVSVSNTTFTLSDIRGFVAGDFSAVKLYTDTNNSGAYDVGDTLIGNGTVSINGSVGTVTFTSGYTLSATTDFIVTASMSSIDGYDELTIKLPNSGIVATGVASGSSLPATGVVSPVAHRKIAVGSGGNSYTPVGPAEIGDPPPAGDGDQGGGTQGGGGEAGGTPGGGGSQGGGGSGGGGEAFFNILKIKMAIASVWLAMSKIIESSIVSVR